jgi:hypothetical protein
MHECAACTQSMLGPSAFDNVLLLFQIVDSILSRIHVYLYLYVFYGVDKCMSK